MADVPPELGKNLTGIFIAAIVALAGVVAYLFRLLNVRVNKTERLSAEKDKVIADKDKSAAIERVQAEVRLEKLRADFEAENRELAEQYAQDVRALYDDNRAHEDAARKEFAEIMEKIDAKAGESSKAIVTMLDKFYERFVGPRARY